MDDFRASDGPGAAAGATAGRRFTTAGRDGVTGAGNARLRPARAGETCLRGIDAGRTGLNGVGAALLALGLGLLPVAATAQAGAEQDAPATTTAPGDRPMPGGMQEGGLPETSPGASPALEGEVIPPRQPGTATGVPGENGVADAPNRGMMERMLEQRGMGMQGGARDEGTGGGMTGQGMMGHGMMQGGMMQGGMMGHHAGGQGGGQGGHGAMGAGAGHGAAIPRLMFLLIDRDGDGALSLEELREVQERVFREMDADGDGGVTPEEIEGFMGRMMSHRP